MISALDHFVKTHFLRLLEVISISKLLFFFETSMRIQFFIV